VLSAAQCSRDSLYRQWALNGLSGAPLGHLTRNPTELTITCVTISMDSQRK